MAALIYILRRTSINYIKRLREKPVRLVGPIFVTLWLVIMFLPNKNNNLSAAASPEIFVSIFTIIISCFLLYAIYKGAKSADSKFGMCDVNLIFTAPIKPQTVMIYGLIKKIAVESLASVYMLFQIPNLLRNYKISSISLSLVIISLLLFQFIFCNITGLFVFALCTKYNRLRGIIRNSIKLLLLSAAAFSGLFLFKFGIGKGLDSIGYFLTYNNWFKFFPAVGWMREICIQTLRGINASYFIYFFLIIISSILILYITYQMDIDFYEEMLTSAENNDLVYKAKTGKQVNRNNQGRTLFKARRNVELRLSNIYGAKAFFYKHMNEYMKRGYIFFINLYSLLLLTASILLGVFLKQTDIKFIFMGGAALLFFSSGFGGKIYNEISYHYIFLVPDKKERKLFYGTASSFIKIISDGIFLFLPFTILARGSFIDFLLCLITYLAVGIMMNISGVFAYRAAIFLGFTGIIAGTIFYMLFQIALLIGAVVLTGIGTAGFASFNSFSMYYSLLIYSIVLAGLFTTGAAGLFDNMEF
jgi:hypothetical protein